jgi:hypothetical protein
MIMGCFNNTLLEPPILVNKLPVKFFLTSYNTWNNTYTWDNILTVIENLVKFKGGHKITLRNINSLYLHLLEEVFSYNIRIPRTANKINFIISPTNCNVK